MSYDYNVNQVNTNYGGDGSWRNAMPPTPENRRIVVPMIARGVPPQRIQEFLDNAVVSMNPSAVDFVDSESRGVHIPLIEGTKTPVLPAEYAEMWWDVKNGWLRVGDDDKTLYRRNFDENEGVLKNTYKKVTSVEAEYEVPAKKFIKGMKREAAAVLKTLSFPRVHAGIQFGSTAFIREYTSDTESCVTQLPAEDRRNLEPFEVHFDCEFDAKLAAEARRWIEWMTVDEKSADNLARMFATPVLERHKALTFIGYGRGRNGKGTIVSNMMDDPTTAAFTTTFNSRIMFPTGSPSTIQEQAPLNLVGKLWAFEPECAPIGSAQMTALKALSTGDSITARRLQQQSVNVNNTATLVIFTNESVCLPDTEAGDRRFVNIRFKDGHTDAEFAPLWAFFNKYGVAPFMMASCLLWLESEDPHVVNINDGDAMSEYEMALADAIVTKGYATREDLPTWNVKAAEDSRTRLGVGMGRERIVNLDGSTSSVRCFKVKNESRFAPFRARVLGDIAKANEVADAADSAIAEVVRKTFKNLQDMKLGDSADFANLAYWLTANGTVADVEEAKTEIDKLVAANVLAFDGKAYTLVG